MKPIVFDKNAEEVIFKYKSDKLKEIKPKYYKMFRDRVLQEINKEKGRKRYSSIKYIKDL